MPDIRVKDLATTATHPASDDFLCVDGATNGTRKVAARRGVAQINNADTTISAGELGAETSTTALTAHRVITLPAAASVPDGWGVDILDSGKAVGANYWLAITRSGSDVILSGGLEWTSVDLAVTGGSVRLVSNGSSRWTVCGTLSSVNFGFVASNSSWSYPRGYSVCEMDGIGSGAGGGSGRRGAAGTARYGGGGGAPGARSICTARMLNLSVLGTTLNITIPAGGTGGAAPTTDDTNGNAGTASSATTVSCGGVNFLYAGGGSNAGGGGTNAAGATGNGAGAGTYGPANGSSASISAQVSVTGNAPMCGVSSPPGGSVDASNVHYAGGRWSGANICSAQHRLSNATGGTAGGGDGADASMTGSGYALFPVPPVGGGGNNAGGGGRGGDGLRGHGGAGAGASTNGTTGGAGGDGGIGVLVLYFF